MRFTFLPKIAIILSIIILTYLYAVWEKQKYYNRDDNYSASLVLKELPAFTAYTIDSQKISVNSASSSFPLAMITSSPERV